MAFEPLYTRATVGLYVSHEPNRFRRDARVVAWQAVELPQPTGRHHAECRKFCSSSVSVDRAAPSGRLARRANVQTAVSEPRRI